MASYINEPFFATEAKVIGASDTIDSTTFLDASAIYVGSAGNLNVIMRGVVGNRAVTAITTTSSGGSYTTATGLAVTSASGAGTGMTIDITAVAGLIDSVAINAAGSGYEAADTLSIVQSGASGGTVQIDSIQNLPAASQAVLFAAVPVGTMMPVIVDYVIATGTVASALVAYK